MASFWDLPTPANWNVQNVQICRFTQATFSKLTKHWNQNNFEETLEPNLFLFSLRSNIYCRPCVLIFASLGLIGLAQKPFSYHQYSEWSVRKYQKIRKKNYGLNFWKQDFSNFLLQNLKIDFISHKCIQLGFVYCKDYNS